MKFLEENPEKLQLRLKKLFENFSIIQKEDSLDSLNSNLSLIKESIQGNF